MFPLLAAALPALGGVISSVVGAEAQSSANETNAGIAREQMAFQERMSSTAHQREVDDLRKAGLNPVLAANSGSSTPGGASATMQAANPVSGLGSSITSAFDAANAIQDLGNKEAQKIATIAQANASQAAAENSRVNAAYTQAEMPSVIARSSTAMSEADARKAEAILRKKTSEIDSNAAEYDAVTSRLYQGIGAASDALSLKNLILGGKVRGARGGRQKGPAELDHEFLERQGALGARTSPPR